MERKSLEKCIQKRCLEKCVWNLYGWRTVYSTMEFSPLQFVCEHLYQPVCPSICQCVCVGVCVCFRLFILGLQNCLSDINVFVDLSFFMFCSLIVFVSILYMSQGEAEVSILPLPRLYIVVVPTVGGRRCDLRHTRCTWTCERDSLYVR